MLLDGLKSALFGPIDPTLKARENFRLASVLVVIYGQEPTILMTKKPKHMKFHAGEIAFPGGKLDTNDADLLETALRETCEEVGLEIRREQVTCQLEPVITLNSGFLILPFVCIVDAIPKLVANSEVEKILHIPLESLLETVSCDTDPLHNAIQEMYTFEYQDEIVWGASARILKQIQDRLKR